MSKNFIKNPSTIEEFEQNVEFQMESVKGYIALKEYESALIKAKCLIDALSKIVSKEEAECIAKYIANYENDPASPRT
jgi:hypothetical protein